MLTELIKELEKLLEECQTNELKEKLPFLYKNSPADQLKAINSWYKLGKDKFEEIIKKEGIKVRIIIRHRLEIIKNNASKCKQTILEKNLINKISELLSWWSERGDSWHKDHLFQPKDFLEK